MLIFLLIFQTIVLCMCVLCNKMIQKKYIDIQNSIKILNNPRAYRTLDKVYFIRNIIDRYQSYRETHSENVDLKEIIKGDLIKSEIGKFTFISVYNIATRIKIIMRYSVLIEIIIICVNDRFNSMIDIIILSVGITLSVLLEIVVIVQALDKKQESVILIVEEYVLYKYQIELNTIKANNVYSEGLKKNTKEYNEKLNTIESNNENINDLQIDKDKHKPNTNNKNRITDKDIASVIKRINLSNSKE